MGQAQRTPLRSTVADTKGFCAWALGARPGDWVVYHIGNLAIDRLKSPDLSEVADIVQVLSDKSYVAGMQYRLSLPAIAGWQYVATRTG